VCDKITAMATSEEATFIAEAVGSLCEPMYLSVEKAADLAQLHFVEHDMAGSIHRRERTDLTRAHLRRLLQESNLGPWQLHDKTSNGQVLLLSGMLVLRVLHIGPEQSIPAPGLNLARINYYRNPDLGLWGVQASKLISVWSVDAETGEASIRIARPVGTWKHAQPNLVDIDFPLPRTSADVAALEFVPDDSGLPLPFTTEEEGDDGADGARGW
jgi:hypothetical protein